MRTGLLQASYKTDALNLPQVAGGRVLFFSKDMVRKEVSQHTQDNVNEHSGERKNDECCGNLKVAAVEKTLPRLERPVAPERIPYSRQDKQATNHANHTGKESRNLTHGR